MRFPVGCLAGEMCLKNVQSSLSRPALLLDRDSLGSHRVFEHCTKGS
jgi:hypothetical protein